MELLEGADNGVDVVLVGVRQLLVVFRMGAAHNCRHLETILGKLIEFGAVYLSRLVE